MKNFFILASAILINTGHTYTYKTFQEISADKVGQMLIEENGAELLNFVINNCSIGVLDSIYKSLVHNNLLILREYMPEPITLEGHKNCVQAIAFSPNGKYAISCSHDSIALLWDLSKKQIKSTPLLGHTTEIYAVAFSPDGKHALTGESRGPNVASKAILWDLTQDPIKSQILEGHTHTIFWAKFTSDGMHVFTASIDATLRTWDLSQSPIKMEIVAENFFNRSVAISRNNRYWINGSFDGPIYLIDSLKASNEGQMFQGHKQAVYSIEFSNDSKKFLTGSSDNTARLWDLTQDKITSTILNSHKGRVNSVAFNPNGKFALTASDDNTALLWDISQENIKSIILHQHDKGIYSAAFSPDGKYILTGCKDGTLKLWPLIPSISLQELILLIKSTRLNN